MLRQLERSTIHLLVKRGKSQRQVARELGLSRTTVARALHEPLDKKPAKRQRSSIVDPYQSQIEGWLEEGLSIVRMLELARADLLQPYAGGRSVFSDYVRRLRQQKARVGAEVAVRFEGLAGEYLQVDWGEVRRFPFGGQPPATRYFLACRLKYSRWSWVQWTKRQDQETLIRGLVDCFLALGFVPWVLVFDNMKTVTSGRDAQGQAIWQPVLLQFAREFDFHPEACAVGAANQKGSVESLVKWVKGNFLAGRSFLDDADLGEQTTGWLDLANQRPNAATAEPPNVRLVAEAAKAGPLPASAADYGFPQSAQANGESLVHVAGNTYSVPVEHIGAPLCLRLHRGRVRIWRDTLLVADHPRLPDGAHGRVIDPAHFAPLFTKKPRAATMLWRAALLALEGSAPGYLAELSRRRRARLAQEVAAVYTLYEHHGAAALLGAMAKSQGLGVWGADYLRLLLEPPAPDDEPAAGLLAAPPQSAVDRLLSSYEAWVGTDTHERGLGVLAGAGR